MWWFLVHGCTLELFPKGSSPDEKVHKRLFQGLLPGKEKNSPFPSQKQLFQKFCEWFLHHFNECCFFTLLLKYILYIFGK